MVDLTSLTSDKFPPTPACINVYQSPKACCSFEVFRIHRYGWYTRGHFDTCGPPCTVKFRTLWAPRGFPCKVCKIPTRCSMGSRFFTYFFLFLRVSLCKIQGGTARKYGYLARNPAVFLCCPKSVSGDDCSVLYCMFFTVVEKQSPRKYV